MPEFPVFITPDTPEPGFATGAVKSPGRVFQGPVNAAAFALHFAGCEDGGNPDEGGVHRRYAIASVDDAVGRLQQDLGGDVAFLVRIHECAAHIPAEDPAPFTAEEREGHLLLRAARELHTFAKLAAATQEPTGDSDDEREWGRMVSGAEATYWSMVATGDGCRHGDTETAKRIVESAQEALREARFASRMPRPSRGGGDTLRWAREMATAEGAQRFLWDAQGCLKALHVHRWRRTPHTEAAQGGR